MDKTLPSPLRVDLGCGSTKSDGFIGVDRIEMPGVDLIGDLDGTLPFESDAVDMLFASHSLEHARDIIHTMKEVYRICKHGAQVCVVAPYYEQKLNLANPYHLNVFNEHTPRFWTNSKVANTDGRQYWHPHAESWGLAESDNSDPGIDFRLARMELFYFPEFLGLSAEERLEARRHNIDVCDQILFHLIVWKRPEASEEEVTRQISTLDLYDPPLVSARRMKDASLASDIESGAIEVGGYHTSGSVRRDMNRNIDTIARLDERVSSLAASADKVAQLEEQMAALSEKVTAFEKYKAEADTRTIADLRQRLSTAESRSASNKKDLAAQVKKIDTLEASLRFTRGDAEYQGTLLEDAWIDALRLADENSRQRSRKVVRALERLMSRNNLAPDLSPEYSGVVAKAHGRRIVPGADLRLCPFVPYQVKLRTTNAKALEVGFIQTVRNVGDRVGLEIVTGDGRIVWNVTYALDESRGPVRFPVELAGLAPGSMLEVRIFSSTRIAPIFPMEIVRGRISNRRDILARWL